MDVREDGRLILRIEEYEMASNYENYQQAQQDLGNADMRLLDCQGGSTEQAMQQATENQAAASQAADQAWQKFLDDPAG